MSYSKKSTDFWRMHLSNQTNQFFKEDDTYLYINSLQLIVKKGNY